MNDFELVARTFAALLDAAGPGGGCVPIPTELAKAAGVSVAEVRKGVAALEAMGHIEVDRGGEGGPSVIFISGRDVCGLQ